MIRLLLITLALCSLLLGGIGIILPGLPTTPFVLLSAALFLRSSDTLYQKLLKSRLFGKYLRRYMEQKGMTLKGKISSIVLMWVMISISLFSIGNVYFTISIILLGVTGTAVMGFAVHTVPAEDGSRDAVSPFETSPTETSPTETDGNALFNEESP